MAVVAPETPVDKQWSWLPCQLDFLHSRSAIRLGSRGGSTRGMSGGQPPRPFRGGPMHHIGGPMGANNMNMGPRAPAPMMGSMGPGPRVGRGGMPGGPGNDSRNDRPTEG